MKTKQIYAVIGDPIGHSLSPVMHNAAFRALSIDAEYIAIQVKGNALSAFANDARKKLAGFNITVPHKSGIIPFLDSVSHESRLADSVNTVKVMENGQLYGATTDGFGLREALRDSFDFSPEKQTITFAGSGGVVRALAFHFAISGVKKLCLLNRTLEKADQLAQALKEAYPVLNVQTGALNDREKTEEFLAESSLLLQCTSLGLKPDDPAPIDPDLLPHGILLYDTIYKPTRLLREAEARGIRTANGLGMLLHQGARAFSIWTGQDAPLDVMREALLSAYKERENA